ncbi:hypothetical protein B0H10DRAFT_1980007 [Mycena sp. CBHHK59/15]|nr:hypothetical protein B0H10DRAFT_1980007 [Mycena sp. CBHHK59/15]
MIICQRASREVAKSPTICITDFPGRVPSSLSQYLPPLHAPVARAVRPCGPPMSDSEPNPFAAFADLTLGDLEDSLGVLYIGYILGTVGYGFTFFQSYYYYGNYPKDYWVIKAMVASLCALDTTMSALSSHAIYYYLVTLFALPVGPERATPTFCVEVLLSAIAVFVVQIFYALRIRQLSRNNVVTWAIIFVSTAAAGLGIASGATMLRNRVFADFSEPHIKVVVSASQGLRFLAALLTAGGLMLYAVRPPRAEPPSVTEPIRIFLTSGVAAAAAQLACLITFVAMSQRYVWIVFHQLSSRVFINGLLLLLNSRAITRGRGMYDEETRVPRSALSNLSFTPQDQLQPGTTTDPVGSGGSTDVDTDGKQGTGRYRDSVLSERSQIQTGKADVDVL